MRFGITRPPAATPLFPNHPDNLPEGTLRAIFKQAGINPETVLTQK